MIEILYREGLSREESYALYKKMVGRFCEYMKIPMLEDRFCPYAYFDRNAWSVNFLDDVSYTATRHLEELLVIKEKFARDSEDFRKWRRQLEIFLCDWVLRGPDASYLKVYVEVKK